jgi:hypothetical protein
VAFDSGPQVEELRRWFEALWRQTGPVRAGELRAWLAAAPERPPACTPPLVGRFPGVAAVLAPTALRLHPDVEAVLARATPAVRELIGRLREHLEDDGAFVKSTATGGGDVRHFYTRVNFSEIRLRRDAVILRLRLGKGAVEDSELGWNQGVHDSADIAGIRLPAGEPIPRKVLGWIARAKAFTRERFG